MKLYLDTSMMIQLGLFYIIILSPGRQNEKPSRIEEAILPLIPSTAIQLNYLTFTVTHVILFST
jgi:hypothetical protein